MSSWRVAVRIARREARRTKGRSALVVTLIGLPALGLAFAAVTVDSFRLTATQELDRTIGSADALVRWQDDGPVTQGVDGEGFIYADSAPPEVTAADLVAVLPPDSRVVPVRRGDLEVRTATGIGALPAEEADLADPIHEGRIVLRDGRAPSDSDEVAMTPEAGRRLGASIGDQISTSDASRQWTVVGIVEYPAEFREALVFYPYTPDGHPAGSWLVDTAEPVTWDQVLALNRHGITARSRAVVLDPPPEEAIPPEWRVESGGVDGQIVTIGVVVTGLALLEVVLLAGPAFAVNARRRQRELALIATNGGAPAQLRRIVLADGIVLGAIGAVVGIGLGAVAALAGLPLLEEQVFGRRAGGSRLWPEALAAVAGLAIVTGLLAALVPAATAARREVVLALSGRRGIVHSRKRWLLLGLVLAGLGATAAAAGAWRSDTGMLLGGLVIGELGLVLCTPALVGLIARGGRFLPLSPRIALRDTARNRAAAAPAISAVMAAVAGSVAIGMFSTSEGARYQDVFELGLPMGYAHVPYQQWYGEAPTILTADQRAAVRTAMRDTLPAVRVIEPAGPACPAQVGAAIGCGLHIPKPPENRCPYADEARELTRAEMRAARADPRCGEAGWTSGGFLPTVVDDGSLLPALTDASGDDAAAAAAILRAGGVVVTDRWLLVDGMATVEVWDDPEAEASARLLRVPAHVLTTGTISRMTSFVSPQLVDRAGLSTQPAAAVAVTSRMPSQAEQDALRERIRLVDSGLWVGVESGWGDPNDPTVRVLAAAAGLITLGAAAIGTALVAADRRADLATLAAVGATPRVRRLLSLCQSGVIAGLGALLGALAGLGAAATILSAMNRSLPNTWPFEEPFPLLVPWSTLAIVLLVVPVIAMLGAGLLTRSRLPIERRPT